MNASFVDVTWVKGDSAIYTGYRNGERPKGKSYGGNGTFRVNSPSEVLLELETKDGNLSVDINHSLKKILGWKKMSNKRMNKLNAYLPEVDWEVNDQGQIQNLDTILSRLA